MSRILRYVSSRRVASGRGARPGPRDLAWEKPYFPVPQWGRFRFRSPRRSADRPSLPLSTFQVTKKMDKKKQDKHSRVKTFIKTVNYNHLMPTRYTLDVDLKATVTPTRWRTRRRRLPRARRPRRFWRRGSRLASLKHLTRLAF